MDRSDQHRPARPHAQDTDAAPVQRLAESYASGARTGAAPVQGNGNYRHRDTIADAAPVQARKVKSKLEEPPKVQTGVNTVAAGWGWHKEPDRERQPVEVHAERFLGWLQAAEWPHRAELTSAEAALAYIEMCQEQGLEPRPWNALAAAFSKLIWFSGRPRKTYRPMPDPVTGERVRKRIFLIPERLPSGNVVPLEPGLSAQKDAKKRNA